MPVKQEFDFSLRNSNTHRRQMQKGVAHFYY